MGGGLLAQGITAYGFLVVCARAVGPERYVGVSVLWAVTFLVAFGFFIPLEQEVARGLASRGGSGAGGGPFVRRIALLGATVLAALLLATLLGSPLLLRELFDRQVLLVLSLGLAFSSYFVVHLARGILAGTHALATYGALLAVEGLLRLSACVALAVGGSTTAGMYGLAFALAPFAAVVLTVRPKLIPKDTGPGASLAAPPAALGHLVAGSLLSQMLMNGPVPALKLLASSAEQADAGRLLAGLAVARVQLFLFSAVLVALLPKLADLASRGEVSRFRSQLRRLVLLVAAIGAACTAGAALVGERGTRLVFGTGFSLAGRDLVLLTAANALLLLALTSSQSLVAIAAHGRVAIGWACGVVAFLAVTAMPGKVILRVESAFLAGAVAAAAALAVLLLARLRRPIGHGLEEAPPPAMDLSPP